MRTTWLVYGKSAATDNAHLGGPPLFVRRRRQAFQVMYAQDRDRHIRNWAFPALSDGFGELR